MKLDSLITNSWKEELKEEFQLPYFKTLSDFLIAEKKEFTIYPPESLIFNALNKTDFNNVKVVIIGQDPYHGTGQAHGLAFSVQFGVKSPPSLANIYKELKTDLNIPIPAHGNLDKWANQGVLLINESFTVRAGQAGSHQGKGWESFTDAIINKLSEKKTDLVFILWGKFAQKKEYLIDLKKHCVLKAAHPSPLSAYNGFFGCKHFSKANDFLKQHSIQEINWDPGVGGVFA
jgi:uracil-DNA glycosylase